MLFFFISLDIFLPKFNLNLPVIWLLISFVYPIPYPHLSLAKGVYTFGVAAFGALGRTGNQCIPMPVSFSTTVVQVACGLEHTLALTSTFAMH